MPPAKPRSVLMRMVDSDPEDELTDLPVAVKPRVASTPVMPPKKKPRGRPPGAANKVTKPAPKKTAGRRTSGRIAVAAAAEIEEEPSLVLSDKGIQSTARASRRKAKDVVPDSVEKPKATRGRLRAVKSAAPEPMEVDEKEDMDDTRDAVSPAHAPPPKKRGRKPASAKTEIPETQLPETMDFDDEAIDDLDDLPARIPSDASHPHSHRSLVPSTVRSQRVTDLDTSDSSLRRRLGDLSRKYEVLEAKYRQIQEVGTKEADRNFDRFKKQADERAETSKQLIADLKAELADQTKLEKKLEDYEATMASLQEKITSLTTSLSSAKAENKTLSTKLAASRSAEAALAKVPGSAVKSSGPGARNGVSSDILHAAQMKEDLYSDLTGLIIRGVKDEAKEDIFDCLQTGRNGTLHFKLSIETDISGDGFEEAQVTYQPQLDPNRDRALIDLLPEYLGEEISFPRPASAKFYARVTRALTESME